MTNLLQENTVKATSQIERLGVTRRDLVLANTHFTSILVITNWNRYDK